MEPVSMNISANNKFRSNFVTNHSLYSYPSDDLFLTTVLAGGHFTGPGLLSLSHSYPPVGLGFNRQQPPLLPLPVNHKIMNIYRSNSSCNNNNNTNNNNNIRLSNPLNKKNVKTRGRDHSVTPKKSKNHKQNHKRDEKDLQISETSEMIGPDPKDIPKDVIARVFSLSANNNNNKSCETVSIDVDDKFSGSVVFTPSPPPSSLPLPTFSLRPKLGCNAQAAVTSGVDAGATDSLRRLLRL